MGRPTSMQPNGHGLANRGPRGSALALVVNRDTLALPKAMGRPMSVRSHGHRSANRCPRGPALGAPRQMRAPQFDGLADVGADPWAWVGQPLPTRIRFGFSRASPKPWAGRPMGSPMGMGRPTAAHADPFWVYSGHARSPNPWGGRTMRTPMGMGRPTITHAYPPGHAGPTRQLAYHRAPMGGPTIDPTERHVVVGIRQWVAAGAPSQRASALGTRDSPCAIIPQCAPHA
ncbi:hypothetical protein FOMPIDRAFT_1051542 [Fomitopsis schrenkii]|uniref:Uncharacterized protein n=1 Tax=Fomitopsis schrenkii TaxID=2126942 RepID=S8FIV7_FOMSC|nr:hypothetical protein FOMPIDRAFT_1051542 [Fomitopsis schrenkii]